MATEASSNGRGNVQTIRNMWTSKTPDEETPKRKKSNTSTMKITKEQSSSKLNNDKTNTVEQLKSTQGNSISSTPPTKAAVNFKDETPSIETLKQSTNQTEIIQNKSSNFFRQVTKQNAARTWQKTRLVIRTSRAFNQARRASDTILPLLMKTHLYRQRPRTDSTDSTSSEAPFGQVIDYLNKHKENEETPIPKPRKLRRSASDAKVCIRRNKLDESIAQYEMIVRHLKNYDQFISEQHPSSPPLPHVSVSSKKRQKSFDSKQINTMMAEKDKVPTTNISSRRKTKSLSKHVGGTFSEFIANDLFLSLTPNESRSLSISHASSQADGSEAITDVVESIQIVNEPVQNEDQQINNPPKTVDYLQSNEKSILTNEEVKVVLNELDTVLDNKDTEVSITPNSEINVIVVNLSDTSKEDKLPLMEKPLMQCLFEGKKTAYSPDDLEMKEVRLPEEMLPAYEIAKERCFFDTEKVLYTTKAIKISRRGYKQHVRLLCITTERLYNLTKKKPYPKEAIFFNQIIGITCTPYKDGFICIHTRECHDDRGDWLLIVDHPCECITQLFMAIGRDNNLDDFLKIKTEFTHCRRFVGESSSSDCTVTTVKDDYFFVKKTDFDAIAIV